MGGPIFDRQVFVKKQQKEKPPTKPLLPGAFLLLLVAALASFATYRYVKAGGKSVSNPADTAKIHQLQAKLKLSQARVHELEKSRHVSHARHLATDTIPPKVTPAAAGKPNAVVAKVASHPATRINGTVNHSPGHLAETTPNKAATRREPAKSDDSAQLAAQFKAQMASTQAASNKKFAALQSDLTANRQDWEAATDRLGSVVGEVDSQRTAIQKNQTSVNYLLERAHRSDVSFTLKKGASLEHVGPISMQLSSTSVKGQHYSIRMIVDDKSVVLKDRALNEVVEFYTSRSKYPLRLIVSQIEKGQVSGTLAVPYALGQEINNPQVHELQER